jgi:hypothetical protein
MLLLYLALRLRKADPIPGGTAFVLGLAAGLLTSVQLYFAAWIVGTAVALMLNSWLRGEGRGAGLLKALASCAGAAAGFFVGFEPVIHRYRDFGLWVISLIEHQGRYGHGPAGIASLDQIAANVAGLWNQGWTVILGVATITALTFLGMRARKWRMREDPGWWSASIALLVQDVVLWSAIIKHPGETYLLGVAAILPVQLALALTGLLSSSGRALAIGRTAVAIFFVALVGGMWASLGSHLRGVAQVRTSEDVISGEIEDYAQRNGLDRGNVTILWGYGVPSPCYALRFGNGYASGALQAEIDSVCPNEWEYLVWTDLVRKGPRLQPLQEDDTWDLLFVAEAFTPQDYSNVGEVKITSAETEGFGRIVIVTSRRDRANRGALLAGE